MTSGELEQPETGHDRRHFIKRAALAGAAGVWAAPTIQSLVAPAFATGSGHKECTSCLSGCGEMLQTYDHAVRCWGRSTSKVFFVIYQLCCDGSGEAKILVGSYRYGQRVTFLFDRMLQLDCTQSQGSSTSGSHQSGYQNSSYQSGYQSSYQSGYQSQTSGHHHDGDHDRDHDKDHDGHDGHYSYPDCASKFTGTIQDAHGNKLTFAFEDHTSPGSMIDSVSLRVTSAGGQELIGAVGTPDRGNLQTTENKAPCVRKCSDC